MRAVFESLGMHDVVAKSLGSSNPYNLVRATFDALKHEDSPRSVAARRGLKVSQLAEPASRYRRRVDRLSRVRRLSHGKEPPAAEARPSPSSRSVARSAAPRISARRWSAWASTSSTAARPWRTRPVRGMIAKLGHLVRVVEAE